jgi:fatty acid omega-hydroxylase
VAGWRANIVWENFIRGVQNPTLVVDPPPYRHSQILRGPRHLWIDFEQITA